MHLFTSLKLYVRGLLGCVMLLFANLNASAVEEVRTFQLNVVGQAHQPLSFQVDLMQTPDQRAHGLMGRASLPTGQGMLFDFKKAEIVRMWMYKTLISLDMLFIGADACVHYIHKNAQPHDRKIITSPSPTRWVLELNGGVSDVLKIAVGDCISSKEVDLLKKKR